MTRLQHRVAVYVCVEAQVETVVRHMCKEFGGATVTKSDGFWLDDSGNLHVDRTVVVTSFTDRAVEAREMGAVVEWMFANSQELAISVETGAGLVIFDRAEFVKQEVVA